MLDPVPLHPPFLLFAFLVIVVPAYLGEKQVLGRTAGATLLFAIGFAGGGLAFHAEYPAASLLDWGMLLSTVLGGVVGSCVFLAVWRHSRKAADTTYPHPRRPKER